MTDPIVDEVRRVRDAHAARFNYNLDAIFQDIKDQERRSGRTFVTYPPRAVEPHPATPPLPSQTPVPGDSAPSSSAPANLG